MGFVEIGRDGSILISRATVVRRSRPIFRIMPIDEWGDEGTWETVVDFTKFRKGGVRAEEVLASLKRLEKYE